MAVFTYRARDAEGKTAKGVVESGNLPDAIKSLRRRRLLLISVKEQKRSRFSKDTKVKLREMVMFSRQLATLVDSGIPLLRGLSALAAPLKNTDLKKIIIHVRDDVETGSSLSEALSKHPRVFSSLYVNMVSAGETSGKLNEMLDRVAAYLEKADNLRRKVKSALTYPALIVIIAVLITSFLILKIVPGFKDIFSNLGASLPGPTMVLIAFSDLMKQYFIYVVIFLTGISLFFLWYIRTPRGKLKFDQFNLKLPAFGSLFQKVAIARFSRTLATLLKSDVPILTSLEIVGKISENRVLDVALEKVRANVREGESIAAPMGREKIFPAMVVDMVSIGEESGELEKMLNKIADFYENEVDAAISSLTSLIEPFVIIFLGVVIGSIVVTMFLPIFQLSEIMGR